METKIKRILRVYYWPIFYLILTVEVSFFILLVYLDKSNSLDKFMELTVQGLLTLIATFIGILTPLQIERHLKKEDDRRTLSSALSFLAAELRSNLHMLRQIRLNFKFNAILNDIDDPLDKINTLENKFYSITDQLKLISFQSYNAIQNSNAASTIDEDGYYNDIMLVYDSLNLFISAITLTNADIQMKRYLFSQTFDPLSGVDKEDIVNHVIEQLINSRSELEFSINLHEKAQATIDNKLQTLGIKIIFVKRNVERKDLL